MPDLLKHRQFFGDGPRDFALPTPMIVELERVCGCGIGALARRFFASDFRHQELLEVVRLGLIGGGTDPQSAASLTATYAAPLPIMELYALALPIVEVVMFGKAAKKKGTKP
jgi:hypothetical protein